MREPHGPSILIFVAITASSLASCGQLVTPVDELTIHCEQNDQCPTDYFCRETGTCEANDQGGPPRLFLDGIRVEDGGEYGSSLTVPRGERTSIEYKITNVGESGALRVRVIFSSETCPAFDFDEQLVTARKLVAGASLEEDEVVEITDACDAPATVDVRMETATQQSSGSFELSVQ